MGEDQLSLFLQMNTQTEGGRRRSGMKLVVGVVLLPKLQNWGVNQRRSLQTNVFVIRALSPAPVHFTLDAIAGKAIQQLVYDWLSVGGEWRPALLVWKLQPEGVN